MKVDAGKIVELVRKMKPLFADSSRVSQVKEKGTCDYVTQVDIQVQKLVKEGLYSMYPQVQFMGEEQDNSAIDRSGDFWILDPVDGTTNLIHDFRHSTLSLAYAEAGEVVLGIVYQPYTDELFIAQKGEGAFLNGDPIHVSGAETLSESLVTIGTSPYISPKRKTWCRKQKIKNQNTGYGRRKTVKPAFCYYRDQKHS